MTLPACDLLDLLAFYLCGSEDTVTLAYPQLTLGAVSTDKQHFLSCQKRRMTSSCGYILHFVRLRVNEDGYFIR